MYVYIYIYIINLCGLSVCRPTAVLLCGARDLLAWRVTHWHGFLNHVTRSSLTTPHPFPFFSFFLFTFLLLL